MDASGQIVGAREDLAGPFKGATELVNKLAQSSEVRECISNQWFRFALGRVESKADACSVETIQMAVEKSGGNIRTLLAEVALSDAFRHIRLTAGEE